MPAMPQTADRVSADRVSADRVSADRVSADRVSADRVSADRVSSPFRPPAAPAKQTAARQAVPLPDGFELREMTGYEEEYLEAHGIGSNTAELVNQVLARCLVPPGHDCHAALEAVRGLPVAYRDASLVELRRRSLGSRVASEVDCPSCGEGVAVDFDLTEIPLEVPVAPPRIEHRLTDGRSATLRLPTAGDQADLLDLAIESMAERRSWMLARLVERLGDEAGPFDAQQARALTTRTRRELEAALEEAVPDLDLQMNVLCHSCGHTFSSPFDVASFFFWS